MGGQALEQHVWARFQQRAKRDPRRTSLAVDENARLVARHVSFPSFGWNQKTRRNAPAGSRCFWSELLATCNSISLCQRATRLHAKPRRSYGVGHGGAR